MGTLENLRRIADPAGDSVRQSIRAYHASPRSFNQFDFKHIGTGEGSQAFGHGGYFAGNPKVMEYYYDNFRAAAPGKRSGFRDDVIEHAEQTLARKGSVEEAVAEIMDDYRYFAQSSPSDAQPYMDAADYLRGLSPQKPTRYAVELGVPESSLLDWDAPIHKQPEPVLGALERLGMPVARESIAPDDVAAGLRSAYGSPEPSVLRGSVIYKALGNSVAPASEADRFQAASKRLFDAGVPGMRYLDQGSRYHGPSGTRNYVMFPGTEDQIRILRKYGLLPATFAAEGLVNQENR